MKHWKRMTCLMLCFFILGGLLPTIVPTSSAAESWLWPAEDCYIISSNYGLRDLYGTGSFTNYHYGIDIVGASSTYGMPVRAAKSGTIYSSCNTIADNTYISGSCGNYVAINHGDGTYSIYMHMRPSGVKTSGTVRQGDIVGYIGNTGDSYGAHLHFEMYTNPNNRHESTLNPMPTNSNITIRNTYVLPSGWPTTKTTYIFESESVAPVSGTPVIKSSKTAYEYGETVVLERNTVEHTNFYWIVVWYKDEQLLSTKMEDTTYNLNNLSPGTYTVYLQVGNSTGTVTSEKCTFYVVQRISETPVISSDKARYSIGETVTLSRNSVNNTNFYWIVVWYQDEQLLSTGMETQIYHLDSLDAGMYCVYLTVGNSLGEITSEPYYFVVEDEHTWDSGVTTQESTCKTQGTIKYTCNICGMERDVFLPLKPHSYGNYVISIPTCTEQGYTTHTCTVCGDTYVDSYVDALGHDFEDGICTVCGAADPNYKPDEPTEPSQPCDGGADCPSAKFFDVSGKDWFHLAVDFAVENGLFGGMSPTTFEPDTAMTRAMLVTVLWRYEGEPEAAENTFSDVKAGTWYSDAVSWAAATGVVNGVGNNKFDPEGKITREQMATILYRYSKAKGIDTSKQGSLSGFPDVNKVSSYAQSALQWTVAEGIIGGSDGKLLPQGNATRAQVATILMRYIRMISGGNGDATGH